MISARLMASSSSATSVAEAAGWLEEITAAVPAWRLPPCQSSKNWPRKCKRSAELRGLRTARAAFSASCTSRRCSSQLIEVTAVMDAGHRTWCNLEQVLHVQKRMDQE